MHANLSQQTSHFPLNIKVHPEGEHYSLVPSTPPQLSSRITQYTNEAGCTRLRYFVGHPGVEAYSSRICCSNTGLHAATLISRCRDRCSGQEMGTELDTSISHDRVPPPSEAIHSWSSSLPSPVTKLNYSASTVTSPPWRYNPTVLP